MSIADKKCPFCVQRTTMPTEQFRTSPAAHCSFCGRHYKEVGAMVQGTASIPAYCCLACARLISKTLEGKDMADKKCPFCAVTASRVLVENDAAFAIPDGFPIADGHTLVIPKRHVASLFDLSEDEQAAISRLVAQVRVKLMADLNADGFNIGVNDGVAAGQTVMHAHVHIIPRRKGDSPDPRGGVRWIKPEKARYWD